MNHRRTFHPKGITLIETVVYLGLFSLLLTACAVAGLSLMTAAAEHHERIFVQGEIDFIAQKLQWAARGAREADVTSGTSVSFVRDDMPGESPIVISYEDETGTMTLSRGGAAPLPLHGTGVTIDAATFSFHSGVGEPSFVRASLVVAGVPIEIDAYMHH